MIVARNYFTPALVTAGTSLLVVGIWLLRTYDPNAAGSLFPPCPFHELTGLFCSGCGITRALHALVHFDFVRAMAMNAFLVLSLPLLALMVIQGLVRRPLLPSPLSRLVFDGRLWIVALVVFGIVRNLPGFEWLAPGGLLGQSP